MVDEQRNAREHTADLIGRRVDGARVTGRFARAGEALRALDAGEGFDVVLVELDLPDMKGQELIRQLRSRRPEGAIIALTLRFDDEAVFSTLRAGASGYLTKGGSPDNVVDAIASAAAGAAPFSPKVSRSIAKSFWGSAHAPPAEQRPGSVELAALTPREREVLELICTGASYREVGSALGVTLGTIQSHVKSIYFKLGVTNKAEAVRWLLGDPFVTR